MKINSYTPYDLIPSNAKSISKDDLVSIPKPDLLKDFVLKSKEETGTRRPDDSPENKYAEITINGEVVATVWKTGIAQVSNKYSSILNEISEKSDTAYERANLLAKALNGEVSYHNSNSPSYSFSDSLSKILSSTK